MPTRFGRDAFAVVLALSMSLVGAGCASVGPFSVQGLEKRGPAKDDPAGQARRTTTARRVLMGVAALGAAVAVFGAVQGYRTGASLEDDLAAGRVSGLGYVDRDATGERWNRVARASVFAAALSGIGVGVLWEMGQSARAIGAPAAPRD